jgi:hypothetical protein
MEKGRTDGRIKESGIALVTTLLILAVILMLVGGMSYLLLKGFGAATINKQYATVFDAANGGAEHAAGIISSYWNGGSTSGLGITSTDATYITQILGCTDTTSILTVNVKTSDGKYTMNTTIQCIGRQTMPGVGGALAFPPPKGLAGGGTAAWFLYYSIISESYEAGGAVNKGRTEVVYRMPA